MLWYLTSTEHRGKAYLYVAVRLSEYHKDYNLKGRKERAHVWHFSIKGIPPPTVLSVRQSQTFLSRYFGDQLPVEELPTHWLYSKAHCGAVEMGLEVSLLKCTYTCNTLVISVVIIISKILWGAICLFNRICSLPPACSYRRRYHRTSVIRSAARCCHECIQVTLGNFAFN